MSIPIDRSDAALIAPRTVAIVIAIAVMSFGAVITLLAWAPDLGTKDRAGAHPYSSSAIGYGGLVRLLEARHTPVSVSRLSQSISNRETGLMVLTPGGVRRQVDDGVNIEEPALIILPKWRGRTDPLRPRWQEDIDLRATSDLAQSIGRFDEDARVKRINSPPHIRTSYGTFAPVFEEDLQVITSKALKPVIVAPGGQLLSRVPGRDIYILADPDLANTFGLATPDNARLMLAILDDIRGDLETPIILDATLHGFERSTSLLKIALDVPFIGATLTALAAMFLLGWTALVRFGAPEREDAIFALGKEALTDNTAGLIAMTRRETRMAPGYLTLSRKAAARALGTPKGLSEAELSDLFDRMGEDSTSGMNWSQMAAELRTPAATRDDLLDKAQRLYRWRKEKTHGSE